MLSARLNLLPIWRRRVAVWGFQMLASSFDRLLFLWLHRLGMMGKEDKRILQHLVKPGMAVVDIGANVGLYTMVLAQLTGANGTVYAFEPEPSLFKALETNCSENKINVRLYNCALSHEAGSMLLERSPLNSGDNRLTTEPAANGVRVQVEKFDSVVKDQRVDFVKLDVQGYELNVLKGMATALSSNPDVIIFFELWPRGLGYAGASISELSEFLLHHGFFLFDWSGEFPQRIQLQDAAGKLASNAYTNIIASRRESLV